MGFLGSKLFAACMWMPCIPQTLSQNRKCLANNKINMSTCHVTFFLEIRTRCKKQKLAFNVDVILLIQRAQMKKGGGGRFAIRNWCNPKRQIRQQLTIKCMHAHNKVKALFGLVHQWDRKAEGLAHSNWNVVKMSVCAAVAAYAGPCLRARALCHTQ